MTLPRHALLLLASLLLTSCRAPTEAARPPTTSGPTKIASPAPLVGEEGTLSVGELAKRAPFTVLLFFSADCPVQKAHDPRIREIVATYRTRGVAFAAIASEEGTDAARLRDEVKKRALEMPLFEDRGALLADALGVEYTTHVVVLDAERRIHYSGAIDSERTHLTPRGEPHLRNALDAVLEGKPVAKPRVEPLGCPLLKHA